MAYTATQLSLARTLARGGHTAIEIAAAVGLEQGDVATLLASAMLDENLAPEVPAGGGGAVVRKFPFAYNTPNLLTGAPLYTPTPGDVVLDAWIEIDTPWNGTTPKGDIGTLVGAYAGNGIFANLGGPLDMTAQDSGVNIDNSLLPGVQARSLSAYLTILGVRYLLNPDHSEAPSWPVAASIAFPPLKFTTSDPVKVIVSRDGSASGGDPGATQGAAVLYLVTGTPV